MNHIGKFLLAVTFFGALSAQARWGGILDGEKFPPTSPFYGFDTSGYANTFNELGSLEGQELGRAYINLFSQPGILAANRAAFIGRVLNLIKVRVQNIHQPEVLRSIIPALFMLYPEQSYAQARTNLTHFFQSQGIRLPTDVFDTLTGVDRPEDCPYFSLFDSSVGAAALAVTDQVGGTCYAETGTKAIDFMNASVGAPVPPTSPVVAALATYRTRDDGIDGGFPEDVVETLSKEGGCQGTVSDVNVTEYFLTRGKERYLQQPELKSQFMTLNSYLEDLMKKQSLCKKKELFRAPRHRTLL
jgi:hypothetical protein